MAQLSEHSPPTNVALVRLLPGAIYRVRYAVGSLVAKKVIYLFSFVFFFRGPSGLIPSTKTSLQIPFRPE